MAYPFQTITGELLVVINHSLSVVLLYILDLENKVSDWAISFFSSHPITSQAVSLEEVSSLPQHKNLAVAGGGRTDSHLVEKMTS